MQAKMIAILVLIGVSILFIVQNVAVVDIRFLFWSFPVSRVLLLFLAVLVGIIIGWVLHSMLTHQRNSNS